MRFRRLKLHNITSLRGEHVLDFNEALGEEELFAITGATGSGKSSLLTAISLALYGNTYKKTLNQWEFVTQDEGEASIDLEFSSNGIEYRALWRCKKHVDKHGVLRPKYTRELLAAGTPTDRPIEEVIGLNFEQFKKTIILNQGQFAEFLTATFTERKAILENLAGAELLSDLSKNLKERVREMSRVQGELEARLEGGLPFSDEELAQMRVRIGEINEKLPSAKSMAERFAQDEQDLKELQKWLKDIARYRAEEEGTKLELQSANDILVANKNEQREWQNKFDEFIQKRDQRRPQLQLALKIEKELEGKRIEERALSSKDEERKRREEQFERDKKQWQLRLSQIEQDLKDQSLDADYAKLTATSLKAVEALLSEWDEALKKLALVRNKIENANDRIEQTKKRGTIIAKEIEDLTKQDKALATKDLAGLPTLQKELEILTHDLPLWEELGRVRADLVRRIEQKKRNLMTDTTQLESRKTQLRTNELEYENAQLKKRQFELELALKLVRDKGIDEGNCPACGQDWPAHLSAAVEDCHELPNNIDELGNLVANEKAQIESLVKRISDNQRDIDELIAQETDCASKQQKIESNLKVADKNIDANKLRERRNELQTLVKELEDNKRKVDQIAEALTSKSKERDNLRQEWNEQQKIKEALDEEFKAASALQTRSHKDLKSRIHALPDTFDEARQFLRAQQELSHQKSKLEQEHDAISERFESASTEAKERAKERDQDAKKRTILLQEIQHALENLRPLVPEGDVTKAIKALEVAEDDWSKQKDQWSSKLKELEQKAESARTRHDFMTGQLKKARSELERTLSRVTDRETLNSQNIGFIRGHKKLRQLKQAHEVEAANNEINIWYNDFFTPEANAAKEKLKALETELIEHNKALDIDAKKRRELDKFKQELELAVSQKKRWDALAQVLGQDEFRSFALGLVEERLVAQTNRELEHLCEGRYQITLLENKKQSQDFLVVDHWRGGGERKVSTLSGGETFLVSLAMALSLAELTRGQTEVDAFFIDEGFGTLDRDSIDDVLEVLSNVQSRGKQIGLISHVKALTDRIPVNLHLEKSTLGDSKIKIVYN